VPKVIVTTEGYMFFPPLVESDGETQKLKKLNHHSFFRNPFYHWLSGRGTVTVGSAKTLIENFRQFENVKYYLELPRCKGDK